MSQGDHKETKDNVKLLSAAQAAFELGITKADVARLREQGKLAGVRGKWGRWYYHPDVLAAVITEAPAAEPTSQPPPQTIGDIINEVSNGLHRPEDDAVEERAASDQAPIIRMANAILVLAIEARASDIHIEPESRNVRIRCRIDGVLHEIMKVPNNIKGPLIRRYKIMAGIDLLEMRIPQAGNVPLKHCGNDYDMRVTTFPSRYGENVTMRILHSGNLLGLNKMGMSPDVQADVESTSFDYPSGLILIAGPRGSGLTTTAYNLLRKIHSVEKKNRDTGSTGRILPSRGSPELLRR